MIAFEDLYVNRAFRGIQGKNDTTSPLRRALNSLCNVQSIPLGFNELVIMILIRVLLTNRCLNLRIRIPATIMRGHSALHSMMGAQCTATEEDGGEYTKHKLLFFNAFAFKINMN